jgi:Tfp pilus assembly pilus retraction ATPase PilT
MENAPQLSLSELLHRLSELGGSDLHVTTGTPPLVRVHGEIRPLDGYRPLNSSETKQLAYSVLTDAQKHRFEENLELDFSFGVKGPLAISRQHLSISAARSAQSFALFPTRLSRLKSSDCRQSCRNSARSREDSCWSRAPRVQESRRRWPR